MSIVSTDIKFYKSLIGSSQGGAISSNQIADASVENVFPNVTVDEAEDGDTDLRKIFVKNTNSSNNWTNVAIWKGAPTLSLDDEIAIAIGSDVDDDGTNELIPMSANSVITLYSNDVTSHNVTLVGEDANGNPITEVKALTGFTNTPTSNTFKKLYNVSIPIESHELITIKQGSLLLGQIDATHNSAMLFSHPSTKGEGFKVGTIPVNGYKGIWLKRVVQPGAAVYNNNLLPLAVEGETT